MIVSINYRINTFSDTFTGRNKYHLHSHMWSLFARKFIDKWVVSHSDLRLVAVNITFNKLCQNRNFLKSCTCFQFIVPEKLKVTWRNMGWFFSPPLFFFPEKSTGQAAPDASSAGWKRTSLAKRGKMAEKEKTKGEVEERVKLGLLEESITGRMIDLFQVTPATVWTSFNTTVLSALYSTSTKVESDLIWHVLRN